jgi:hypothetical protein
MSDETVMDMSLDTQTSLPGNFTCDCQMLILSQYLTNLPDNFLYKNLHVKTLDMSKCTNITIITWNFCSNSYIEHIIWPPNIESIQFNCLYNSICIKKIDLGYCDKLMTIGSHFCENTDIVELILPVSIQNIYYYFCTNSKALIHLDLSHCIYLAFIKSYFCSDTNIQSIKFPKSLQKIGSCICCNSHVKDLDFSECKDLKIDIYFMCSVKTLKLYSIDNIDTLCKIQCENLHILNISETKSLDLSFIVGLKNIYLPEGKYCIVGNLTDYLNVNFWLRSSVFTAEHFSSLKWYSYVPAHEMVMLDTSLETV